MDVGHYNVMFPQLLGAKMSAGLQYLGIFRKDNPGFSPIPVYMQVMPAYSWDPRSKDIISPTKVHIVKGV